MSDCASVRVGDAPLAPCVQALRGQSELLSNEVGTDGIDQRVMSGGFREHDPKYQHSVYIARGQSFIGQLAWVLHKLRVANDPEFGRRLKRLIKESPDFRSARAFALDGLGWPIDGAAQRLQNYLNGRIPDVETLVQISDALGVTVADLLGISGPSYVPDEALKGILQHLLELEGIAPDKADTIASASLAAQRLLQVFPDEEPLTTRTKFAARAAWHQQRPQARGM